MARVAVLVLFGTFMVCRPGAAGDKTQWKFGTPENSTTYEFDSDDFTYRETHPDVPAETHNPDEAELKRLRVSWGKAAMGYHDYVGPQSSERKWFESDELHYYRRLSI